MSGHNFAEYEDLPTWHKRIVDEMCKDKRVLIFLALVFGRAAEGNPMSDEEIEEWLDEVFPEKSEEEIRARIEEEYLEEIKEKLKKREELKKKKNALRVNM